MPRRGFTLIELLVVLVLVALITSMVVMAWSDVYRKATLESAIVRLESLDQHMRSYARQHGTPCALEFDQANDRVRKVYDPQQPELQPWQTVGLVLRQIQLASSNDNSQQEVVILYNAAGISATYVLELNTSRRQVWLLFAGASGQLTRLETERESHAALALLTP